MHSQAELVRTIAADFLSGLGRTEDAKLVRSGSGDDFAELALVRHALAASDSRVQLLERALRNYADPTFWEATGASLALAAYDLGEIARGALAGKEGFGAHRD